MSTVLKATSDLVSTAAPPAGPGRLCLGTSDQALAWGLLGSLRRHMRTTRASFRARGGRPTPNSA